MSCIAYVGAQWGDEGKGKIVSYFSRGADLVARFQGGPNAGHTVHIGEKKYVFRIIPSGFLHTKNCLIGNGVVINIQMFLEEMKTMLAIKKGARKHVWISDRAHIILPSHIREEISSLNKMIGTTKMGVGPAYRDKIERSGLRIIDIINNPQCIEDQPEEFKKACVFFKKEHRKQCVDASEMINMVLDNGGKVILEGAQGALLDIDNGHYPFVTSSNTTAAAACTGLGLSPKRIDQIYLVACSYLTKVGGGPFPTAIKDKKIQTYLQQKGNEIDGATNSLRTCGWFDLVMLRRAVLLNKPSGLVLTKLDVLSGLKKVNIATHYNFRGKSVENISSSIGDIFKIKPFYQEFEGWIFDPLKIKTKNDLPKTILTYIRFIEKTLKTPVFAVSIGPEESQLIIL